MSDHYLHIESFLSAKDANDMLRIAESFGSFGPYSNEASNDGLGEQLPQRFDAALNYFSAGIDGHGTEDDEVTAARRTNYFRETYAYGDEVQAAGIEAFMTRPELSRTARRITARSVIVPAIVYANLLIPGQELAVHTDVPEFRGANRKMLPQWLLVTMLHSRLFDEWRIPIVTCASWFGESAGGAFTFYPNGSTAPPRSVSVEHNCAIILDTDRIFHGVERITQSEPTLPDIDQQTRLHYAGDDRWLLQSGDSVLANYLWRDLRYSISWKAYCFNDTDEEALWRDGGDDLSVDFVLDRLEAELRRRGALDGPRPEPTDFALMMISNFVHYPHA